MLLVEQLIIGETMKVLLEFVCVFFFCMKDLIRRAYMTINFGRQYIFLVFYLKLHFVVAIHTFQFYTS